MPPLHYVTGTSGKREAGKKLRHSGIDHEPFAAPRAFWRAGLEFPRVEL